MQPNRTTYHQNASQIALLALKIALSQLGQKEAPGNKNTGVMVDKYLAAVGLNPGYAWCQAFINWCFEQAAKELGVPEPVPNTGGVLACWRQAPSKWKIPGRTIMENPGMILPGDQFILKIGNKGAGHTFLNVSSSKDSQLRTVVTTIEGNTNENGGREGYMVATRHRILNEMPLVGIIRYPDVNKIVNQKTKNHAEEQSCRSTVL